MSHPALEDLPKGWFHHGEHMLALVEQHRPSVVVELGTHNGASAIAMARVLTRWGGVIYCVDTWAGVPKPGKARHPKRIINCATNLVRAGVEARVRLIVAKTTAAAQAWTGPAIDCLYVDADHGYDGCLSDLRLWGAHVRSGGIIAGDDYGHPWYPGAVQAWDEYEREAQMPLQRLQTASVKMSAARFVYGIKP